MKKRKEKVFCRNCGFYNDTLKKCNCINTTINRYTEEHIKEKRLTLKANRKGTCIAFKAKEK